MQGCVCMDFGLSILFWATQTGHDSSLVLALPDFNAPFIIVIAAFGTAIGAVLMQQGHPIAFFNKPLGPWLLHASTYVRELHAIVTTVRKWRQYLFGHSFTILTGHKSLRELMSQVIKTPEQYYYLSKLLGYDYSIQYKSSASNVVTYALSRSAPATPGQLLLLYVPNFDFIDDLRRTLHASPAFQAQLSKVRDTP